MASIYPVSSSRVSDMLLRNRLLTQFDHDRLELLRLQDQLSTGIRISKPSDDAPAAMRAIGVQRLIEQNERVQLNLNTSSSYVSAADNALSSVSERLATLRADALGIVDSTTSETQRSIMVQELQEAINELVDTANHRFRGRYLFAGSTSGQQPFSREDGNIVYSGNQHSLQSFVDNDFLSPTNVNGDQVFGAISASVAGQADLNPVLTLDTRLSELQGGQGVTKGSFLLSDGNSTSTIDISGAETIRDVVQLIETNPPADRSVVVRLSGDGLVLQLDAAGGGNLTVRDAPSGTTAFELGIRDPVGTGTAPLVGDDLNPALTQTTLLRNLLGTRSSALLESGGASNDILIEATANGTETDGVTVQFTSGAAAGDQAIVSYDDVAKTLSIDISPGTTTAKTVVAAVNDTAAFTARLDQKLDSANDGSGVVEFAATAVTSGGSGESLDLTAGLRIEVGGQVHTVTFDGAETVQDLLNGLNQSPANLLARINPQGNGLDIQSRVSGADLRIGENGGTTASQLGVRSFNESTTLDELNFGRGVNVVAGTDFVIRRKDGTALEVDLSGATSVGDVLDRINNHVDNTGFAVEARLAADGNGIEILDANFAGGSPLTIERALSFAVWDLGLVPRGEDNATATSSPDGDLLRGDDVNPQEVAGLFNTLLKMTRAVEDFDLREIERTVEMLDVDYERMNFARAELGSRGRAFDALTRRVEDEQVELKATLSKEIDADLVQAISDLTARQASMQATLQLVGQIVQTSILDYL